MTGPVTPEQYMTDLREARAQVRGPHQAHDGVAWIDTVLAGVRRATAAHEAEQNARRRAAIAWTWATTQHAPRDVPDLMPVDRSSADDVWSRCGARLPVSPTSKAAYACSRHEGHTGRHACGTGVKVAAVWSDGYASAQDVRAAFPAPRPRRRAVGGAA